jgi:hypothetical protein
LETGTKIFCDTFQHTCIWNRVALIIHTAEWYTWLTQQWLVNWEVHTRCRQLQWFMVEASYRWQLNSMFHRYLSAFCQEGNNFSISCSALSLQFFV